MRAQDFVKEALHFVRPGELRGSYTDADMQRMGFRRASNGAWYISQSRWQQLIQQGTLREGDVIRTKFATKQAQRAQDQYQHQSDVEIPLYDRKRNRSVLPKYADLAGGELEPFDHFVAEPSARSKGSSMIIGVTKDFQEVVVSNWFAPVEVTQKFADAMNRGGFSDVPIQRVPIRGYDDQ
jgi:hypothetical protein